MISPNWLVQSSALGAAGLLALGVGVWGAEALTQAAGTMPDEPTSAQVIWVHGSSGLHAAGTIRYVDGVAKTSRAERARQVRAERAAKEAAERRAQIVAQRAFEANRSGELSEGWAERRAKRHAELAAREARAQAVRTHLIELYAGPQCVDYVFEPASKQDHEESPKMRWDKADRHVSDDATEEARKEVEHSLERALEEMQRAFSP